VSLQLSSAPVAPAAATAESAQPAVGGFSRNITYLIFGVLAMVVIVLGIVALKLPA
jgi:hypothetical protein